MTDENLQPPGSAAHGPSGRLAIANLEVSFGQRRVVSMADLRLDHAEIVGLAGESGSGKSMTTLAILGLAHTVGAAVSGSIKLDGLELAGLGAEQLRAMHGADGSLRSSRARRLLSVRCTRSAACLLRRCGCMAQASLKPQTGLPRRCGKYCCRPT